MNVRYVPPSNYKLNFNFRGDKVTIDRDVQPTPMAAPRQNIAQHYRTPTSNNPPAANVLLDGEIALEQSNPMRMWIGVPTSVDSTGRRLFLDTSTLGAVTISTTAPANPLPGSMWWDSTEGQLYLWYIDPGGPPGQWVSVVNQSSGGGGAGSVSEAPTDGFTYGRMNAAWVHVLPTTGGTLTGGLTGTTASFSGALSAASGSLTGNLSLGNWVMPPTPNPGLSIGTQSTVVGGSNLPAFYINAYQGPNPYPDLVGMSGAGMLKIFMQGGEVFFKWGWSGSALPGQTITWPVNNEVVFGQNGDFWAGMSFYAGCGQVYSSASLDPSVVLSAASPSLLLDDWNSNHDYAFYVKSDVIAFAQVPTWTGTPDTTTAPLPIMSWSSGGGATAAGVTANYPLTITNSTNCKLYLTNTNTTGGDWPGVVFNCGSGMANFFQAQKNGLVRWQVQFASSDAETGLNAGSNWLLGRFNDAGSIIDYPLVISRQTGVMALTQSPTAPTPLAGDSSTKLATTAFVTALVATVPTGTVTSVAASGGTTGLTYTGSPITGAGTLTLGGTLAVASGGTGATTAGAALTALGAAPIASPVFTGAPNLPTGSIGVTQTAGNSTTALATTAFVTNAVPLSSAALPSTVGTAAAGTATTWSRSDHVHGAQTITLTGDATGSGTTSIAATLATVNANVGVYVATTVNAKGLVTAGANLTGDVTTSGGAATLATVNSNIGTYQGLTVNGKGLVTAAINQNYLTGNQSITLSGDVTGSGTTAITATLPTVNSNVGVYVATTINAKGLVTAGANLSGDLTTSGAVATLATQAGLVAGTYQGITVNTKGLVTAAVAQNYLTGNQTITLSGDVTGSGTTAITSTLATQPSLTAGTYQGLTVNAKGLVTAAVNAGYVTSSGVTSITAGAGLAGGTITTTGTLSAAPAAAGSLIGNPGTVAAVPGAVTVGSGLSLSTGGTLSATGSGGSVTSVSGAGGATGMTLTGGPITTVGTLTLGGTLAIGSGGTGATTASAALTALGALPLTGGTLNSPGNLGLAGVVLPGDINTANAPGLLLANQIAINTSGANTYPALNFNCYLSTVAGPALHRINSGPAAQFHFQSNQLCVFVAPTAAAGTTPAFTQPAAFVADGHFWAGSGFGAGVSSTWTSLGLSYTATCFGTNPALDFDDNNSVMDVAFYLSYDTLTLAVVPVLETDTTTVPIPIMSWCGGGGTTAPGNAPMITTSVPVGHSAPPYPTTNPPNNGEVFVGAAVTMYTGAGFTNGYYWNAYFDTGGTMRRWQATTGNGKLSFDGTTFSLSSAAAGAAYSTFTWTDLITASATNITIAAGLPLWLNGNHMYIQAPAGQDNASMSANDLALASWFGIGLTTTCPAQTLPMGLYSAYWNSRTGNYWMLGNISAFASSGNSYIQAVTFTRTGTTQYIQLLANSNTPSISSIAAGGTGWNVNDRAYDAYNNTYTVTAVTTGAVTTLTMNQASITVATPPANPVALTAAPGFTGTGLTVNLTWTAPTGLVVQAASGNLSLASSTGNIVIQAASGTIQFNSPSGATTGITGGLHFQQTVDSSSSSIAQHLDLYGGSYGLGITSNRLNTVVPAGAAAVTVVGTADTFAVNAAGAAVTGNLTVSGTTALSGVATAPTAAVGTNTTQIATTAFVQAAPTSYSPNIGRNLLHNSQFLIWQRGAGPFTAANAYNADRWFVGMYTSGDTSSITQITLADADRTAIGDEAAVLAWQNVFVGAATANNYVAVVQRIETVRRVSNKMVTVSFWARATSGTPRMSVGAQQNFGTGGTPSATVLTNIGVTAALSTTWTRYTLTGTVPSASGKTFGTTAGTDYTEIDFFLSCPSLNTTLYAYSGNLGQQSGTVQLWGVQLEIGSSATPLEKLEYADDLRHCQRFYQFGQGTWGGYLAAGSNTGYVPLPLPVTMRVNPTVSVTPSGGTNYSSVTSTTPNIGTITLAINATALGLTNFNYSFTASADL